ncbi:MAG: fimbrillin family protein [Bacteroidaceae bacterium]|nr:fimbrillin family protein [Bacteroidaceae bacterium]
MKKILYFAAATAMMVSCAQTEKINNDLLSNEQAVIGFASYSEKATRGDVTSSSNLEYYHNTFAVYGTKQNKHDATDIQYVFGGKAEAAGVQDGVTCTYQATADLVLGDWKYSDPRIWDKQADYDFIAYAPALAENPIRYYYKAADAEVGDAGNWFKTQSAYILTGTNLQETATKAEIVKGFNTANTDLDLMISGSEAKDGANHGEFVNLSFSHILSKLNVTIGQSEALYNSTVTIKEVEITGFKDKGTYDQSVYNASANPMVSGWTAAQESNSYKLFYNKAGGQVLDNGQYVDDDNDDSTPKVFEAGNPYFFIESLVMPQTIEDDQITLTIKYNITTGNHSEDYQYELDLYDLAALQKFYDGYNYYLNFTLAPDVIKFDASVTTWANQAGVAKTIN